MRLAKTRVVCLETGLAFLLAYKQNISGTSEQTYSVQFLFPNSDLVSSCILYYAYICVYKHIYIHTYKYTRHTKKKSTLIQIYEIILPFFRRMWLKFYSHHKVSHSIRLGIRHLGHFLVSNLQSKKSFLQFPPSKKGTIPPCDQFHAIYFKERYQIVTHFNQSMPW